MKQFTIKIMEQGIVYHHDCTQKEFFDRYDHEEEVDEDVYGKCLREAGYMPRIWVKDNEIGSIIHEVSHAVFWIVTQEMWMPISGDTEEFVAYANEYFVTQIIKKLKMQLLILN